MTTRIMSFPESPVNADPAMLSRFVIINAPTDTPQLTVAQINAKQPKAFIPQGSCEGGVNEPHCLIARLFKPMNTLYHAKFHHCVYADDEATRRLFFGEAELRED